MKTIVLGFLAAAVLWSSAEAKGGKMIQAPVSYDYKREKAAGYKKDYCLNSVGNHIYCPGYKMTESESWTSWH